MKTAFIQVEGVHICCPECEASYEDDNGYELFGIGDYDALPTTLKCESCGAKFRKPPFPAQRKRAA